MTAICIAYTFTCLGFCLGFVAAAILNRNAPGNRRGYSPADDGAATTPPGAE